MASAPQEFVHVEMVEAASPQVVGQPGLQVITPEGVQPHAAALHSDVSVRVVGVVSLPSSMVHSAPPFAGAGLLHVLVLVPDVPHAVALHSLHSLHSPSTPHAAVAAHDLVAATPQELVQVEMVEAAVPHAVGQSGSQTSTPLGTHTAAALAIHAVPLSQQIVVFTFFLHRLSAGSQTSPLTQLVVALHDPQRGFLVPAKAILASSSSLGISASSAKSSAAIGSLSGAVGATCC